MAGTRNIARLATLLTVCGVTAGVVGFVRAKYGWLSLIGLLPIPLLAVAADMALDALWSRFEKH